MKTLTLIATLCGAAFAQQSQSIDRNKVAGQEPQPKLVLGKPLDWTALAAKSPTLNLSKADASLASWLVSPVLTLTLSPETPDTSLRGAFSIDQASNVVIHSPSGGNVATVSPNGEVTGDAKQALQIVAEYIRLMAKRGGK